MNLTFTHWLKSEKDANKTSRNLERKRMKRVRMRNNIGKMRGRMLLCERERELKRKYAGRQVDEELSIKGKKGSFRFRYLSFSLLCEEKEFLCNNIFNLHSSETLQGFMLFKHNIKFSLSSILSLFPSPKTIQNYIHPSQSQDGFPCNIISRSSRKSE